MKQFSLSFKAFPPLSYTKIRMKSKAKMKQFSLSFEAFPPLTYTPLVMHCRWCTEGDAPQVMHRWWWTAGHALQVMHRRWCTAGDALQVMQVVHFFIVFHLFIVSRHFSLFFTVSLCFSLFYFIIFHIFPLFFILFQHFSFICIVLHRFALVFHGSSWFFISYYIFYWGKPYIDFEGYMFKIWWYIEYSQYPL